MSLKPEARSNPGLILGVAVSVMLGVIVGLPMIYRKSGMGLLVVLVISVFAVSTISMVARRKHPALEADPKQTELRTRIRPLWWLISCALVGSSIALIGGGVTHYFSPMHPLDVLPNFLALGLLGLFAGFAVGATLVFAIIFSQRTFQAKTKI